MSSPQARTEKGQWWPSLEGLWGHGSTLTQALVCLWRGWSSFVLCPEFFWLLHSFCPFFCNALALQQPLLTKGPNLNWSFAPFSMFLAFQWSRDPIQQVYGKNTEGKEVNRARGFRRRLGVQSWSHGVLVGTSNFRRFFECHLMQWTIF